MFAVVTVIAAALVGNLAQHHRFNIPRSTAATWRSRGPRPVVTLGEFDQDRQQLLDRIEKGDPGLADRCRQGLLEDPNLLLQVVDPSGHPVINRVRDHRDEELERRREHWSALRLPMDRCTFKSAIDPTIMRESPPMAFRTARVVARRVEDDLTDVARVVRTADLASLRAVILIRGELAKPGEERTI